MLTNAGSKYLPVLTQALDSIADASSNFRSSNLSGILRVSVVPSLGSRWLIPRLDQFALAYPDIIVEPLVTPQVARMNDGVADIAIRHGNGNWADADIIMLRDERLVPVASSGLIKRRQISSGTHLLQYPLLSARARSTEWPHWFVSQGIKLPSSQRFITYESISLAIDASIAGIGIALVDQGLISNDIRQRRLLVLLDNPVSGLGAYYIAMPKSKTPNPKAIVFRDWLISEAARDTH